MRSRRFARVLLGGLFGALTVWVFSPPAMAAEDVFAPMRAKPAVPPAPAPDLALATVTGGSLRLAELRGKAVLLGFFVTT